VRADPVRPLVEVEWYDSCAFAGWDTGAHTLERSKPSSCRSAGYLLEHDDERLVLAQSIDESEPDDERYADVLAIPAAAVRRVRRLRPAR
jgi:hypothetical protein